MEYMNKKLGIEEEKYVYTVWECQYEEEAELIMVFESKKEADEFAEKSNNEGNYNLYFVKPIKFKPREIW